jgi:hypothetical protein
MLMKNDSTSKKNPLSDKLLAYSAAAGAVMAIGGQAAKAQINYTDLDPDVTISSVEAGVKDSLLLDINNDGTNDLMVIQGNGDWYLSFVSARAMPLTNAGIVASSLYYACSTFAGTYTMVAKFELDDGIGPDDNFTTATWENFSIQMGWYQTTNDKCASGPFLDVVDVFLGVRFSLDEGSTFHYGWVRLDATPTFSEIVVKDYAFEETAGTAIAAGAMPTSVRDVMQNKDVQVYSFDNNVVINAVADFSAEAEIFNAIGQRVKLIQVREGRTEIAVNQPGIYMVRLSVDNEMITHKVVIQ